MFPRLFYSRLKFFYLQLEKNFEATNSFLRKHFYSLYQAPPKKKMIRVPKNPKLSNNKPWKSYESDYHGTISNYFDKKMPFLDNMSNKQLQLEFMEVRKNLMDKSKILYLYKRSISSARIGNKISTVKIIRWASLVHLDQICIRVLRN